MGSKHKVFDELTLLADGLTTTVYTIATHALTPVQLKGFNQEQAKGTPKLCIDFFGLDSAGAATIALVILSDNAATPTTAIWTSRTYTLAEAQALFGGVEPFTWNIPLDECGDYIHVTMQVAVAVLTAGELNVGLI